MKTIQVLMSTYNGEKFLDEQMESLINQKGVNVKVLVRDDGSSDSTVSKLIKWEKKGVLKWYSGENLKAAGSFMDLIQNAPKADYYAFCDQDDVWDNNKLISAIEMLQNSNRDEVSLYFSRTRVVDEKLNLIGMSKENPSCDLGGVMMGSHALGCTMVMNERLMLLLQKFKPRYEILHDAWTIRVCLAVGGRVYFDKEPRMNYRQHNDNVVGVNKSSLHRYKRLIKSGIKNKRFKSLIAKELYEGYADLMPIENKELIYQVAHYRNSFSNKLKLAKNKRIRRGNKVDNYIFKLAVLLEIF